VYGKNRGQLEQFVKNYFINHHIIRLCTLIHTDIKKNVLYDLKHSLYLDKINGQAVRQYYPLEKLADDINIIVDHDIQDINLVSEPIEDQLIVDHFFPHVCTQRNPCCNPYNLSCDKLPFDHYILTKNQIFNYIEKYIK
jgi:hypothetical protein